MNEEYEEYENCCLTIFLENIEDHTKYSSNCDEFDAEENQVWFS